MSIFFTSDPHYWHANVIKYCDRPFKDVEEMNEKLVYNWNSVVTENDTVYVLGDFSFAGRSVEIYTHRLLGEKVLVPGNHDPIHPYNKHFKKKAKAGDPNYWKRFYEFNGWNVADLTTTMDIPGVAVINMSHMPYDNADPRYVDYVPKDDGRWLLHGHTHSKSKGSGRMIHVGVDAWNFTPIHIDEIVKIIEEGYERT